MGVARLFDGRPESLLPPRSLRLLVGPGDFTSIGRHTASSLVKHGGLTPTSAFLDVGCGAGRTALALTGWLDPKTPYRGFDIVPQFIDWCRTNITPRYPNFQFDLLDVKNSEYNNTGTCDATATAFPYADASFDFIYAGSVFTHLLSTSTQSYIRECARVLRPGGVFAATFFLINEDSVGLIDEGKARMPLRHIVEGGRLLDPRNPEADVGHDEIRIRDGFASAGFQVENILYGSWCGRREAHDYQDLVIARQT